MKRALALALALASVAVSAWAVGCEDDPAANQPLPPLRSGPPHPRFSPGSSVGSTPVFTKVRPAIVVERRMPIEGASGVSGGGASIALPPSYPRGDVMSADEALAASRDAMQNTGTTQACELAYAAVQDVSRQFHQKTPAARDHLAARAYFMSTCRQKSEIEQWCLVPSYLAHHADECDRRAHTRFGRGAEGFDPSSAPGGEDPDEGATGPSQDDQEQTPAAGPRRLGPSPAVAPGVGEDEDERGAGDHAESAPGPHRDEGGSTPCSTGHCPH